MQLYDTCCSMGTFLNLMQLYLEKDLMNITRDVKFNIVEDVLVKVKSFIFSLAYTTKKKQILRSGDTGRGKYEHTTGNRCEISDGRR